MAYTGLCEKYTPFVPYLASYAMPAAINAPLSHIFNIDAGLFGIMWAGHCAYLAGHFFGKGLTDLYLKDKKSEYGPTRSSKICRRIQTAVAAVPMSLVLAFHMATWDGDTMPEGLTPEEVGAMAPYDEKPTQGALRLITKYY